MEAAMTVTKNNLCVYTSGLNIFNMDYDTHTDQYRHSYSPKTIADLIGAT